MRVYDKNGRFTCIHCGDPFELTGEDKELFDEGFITEPDECDFCVANNLPDDDPDRIDEFSDADIGL